MPSRLAAVGGLLRGNRDLLRNAGSLAATSGITSVFGFGFWIFAARVFAPEAVGYGTAAISAMTLLGTIGMFGIGTMLIGELPRRADRGGLMAAGVIASFLGSLVLGFGFAVVSLAFGAHFVEIAGTFGRMAVFSVGVALTGATLVFDEATIGLMRGGLQLTRNIALSVAKMAALPVCALILHDVFGLGIMVAWVLGTLASVVLVAVTAKRSGVTIWHRPDWKEFRELSKVTLAHNWLNLAIGVPVKLAPVIVVAVVSPADNAAYYVASMLASFLFLVPTHLSTVLFAIAAAAPEVIAEKLRFVLRMSLALGIPGGLLLGVSGHFVLSIFGRSYAGLATGPLWLMIAAYLPALPNTVYIAVCRATGRVNQAAAFLLSAAAVQMAAIVVGGKLDGLYGLSYATLAVITLQSLVTTPYVLRAAYGSGIAATAAVRSVPVRAATALVADDQRELRHAPLDDLIRARQEEGLAALFAVATTVGTDHPAEHGRSRHGAGRHANGGHRGGRHAAVRTTTPMPGLIDDRSFWWPDTNEATFHARQDAGVAALIAIATHAARF